MDGFLTLVDSDATEEEVKIAKIEFLLRNFHITPSDFFAPMLEAMVNYIAELELTEQTDQIYTHLYTALLFYEDLVSQYDE